MGVESLRGRPKRSGARAVLSCDVDWQRQTINRMSKGLNTKMNLKRYVCFLMLSVSVTCAAAARQISAPEPQTGGIIGTVTDIHDDVVPGATVVLQGASLPPQHVQTNDNGFFRLEHLNPGIPYHVTVRASGFADWTSPEVILRPGQFTELTGIRLQIAEAITTVNAVLSTEEIATEQERLEEKQRVLGFIPNFYVVYDHNPAPLTPKLKFRLALKTAMDPITILGSAFLAGVDQAADVPNYGQGAQGYGQRFGADYANFFTDIMIGGAILPTILHQDPRYIYQGTGTTKSRILHALSYPWICRGDNGRWQPNYSSLGGHSGLGRHRQRLLSGVQSRPGADVFDRRRRHCRQHGRRPPTGVCPAQAHPLS